MKKVIVLVSFGVADARVRANCLDKTAFHIARALPGYSLVQAYTSETVRRKMIEGGLGAQSLSECLEELLDSGCEEAYVQPTHLTPGEEYDNKILPVAKEFESRFARLKVGEPVFFHDYDYDDVLAALEESLAREDEEEIVLLGHGSPHRHNPVYERLQQNAQDLPITVGVIEENDKPNFDDVITRLQGKAVKNVLLAPLLVSGGVHVVEDMVGVGKGSWKNRLLDAGFSVRTELRSLGEYPAFRSIYIKKIRRLIG